MGRAGEIYVGTSGWYYDHWTDVLYPPGLPKNQRFAVYAQRYNAVEINATYYRLPSARTVEGWYRKALPGFVYVAKASQDITHSRKLHHCAEPLRRFVEALSGLKEKLANVLFQLPPSLHKDLPLLEDFLALIREKGSDPFSGGGPTPFPASFEFRHASWECEETFEVLRRAGASHVVVSRKGYPFAEVHTSDIAYYRLHGPDRICASSYSDDWLADLARRLVALSKDGVTSFTFFNNDIDGHAVRNADTLNRHLARGGFISISGPHAGEPSGKE